MMRGTGRFGSLPCPFDASGLCHRPFCHFKHSGPAIEQETADASSSSSPHVAQNKPAETLPSRFVGYVGYVATPPPLETETERPIDTLDYEKLSTGKGAALIAAETEKSDAKKCKVVVSTAECDSTTDSNVGPTNLAITDHAPETKPTKTTESGTGSEPTVSSTVKTGFKKPSPSVIEEKRMEKPKLRKTDLPGKVTKKDQDVAILKIKPAPKVKSDTAGTVKLEKKVAEKKPPIKPEKVAAEKIVATKVKPVPAKVNKKAAPQRIVEEYICQVAEIDKQIAALQRKLNRGSDASDGQANTSSDLDEPSTSAAKPAKKNVGDALKNDKVKKEALKRKHEDQQTSRADARRKLQNGSEQRLTVDTAQPDILDSIMNATAETTIHSKGKAAAKSPSGPKLSKTEALTIGEHRVAHSNAAAAMPLRPPAAKGAVPGARQQMRMRFEALKADKARLLAAADHRKTALESAAQAHREGAVAATLPKGERRVAHAPKPAPKPSAGKTERPKIDAANNKSKIATPVRQQYLNMFYDECVRAGAEHETAVESAKREEAALAARVSSKTAYCAGAAHTIRSLRALANSSTSSMPAACSISHGDVLAGKPAEGGVTVKRPADKRKVFGSAQNPFDLKWFCEFLEQYVLGEEALEQNAYPRFDCVADAAYFDHDEVNKKIISDSVLIFTHLRNLLISHCQPRTELSRKCTRCGASFRVCPADKPGEHSGSRGECLYHWGKAFNKRADGRGRFEQRFSCCNADLTVKGCAMADFHVSDVMCRGELAKFIETPPPPIGDNPPNVIALDCEMVYTDFGPALARLSAVNWRCERILDTLVKPAHPVVDCNTRFSGLTPQQLEQAPVDLDGARALLLSVASSDTILMGHSLDSDLRALRLVHGRVVDTALVFPHRRGPPFKRALRTLAAEVLGKIIQDDESGHDSCEDAAACMQLMLHMAKEYAKTLH